MAERYFIGIVYWAMWMLLGWGTYAFIRWRKPLLCRLLGHRWHVPFIIYAPDICRRCGKKS